MHPIPIPHFWSRFLFQNDLAWAHSPFDPQVPKEAPSLTAFASHWLLNEWTKKALTLKASHVFVVLGASSGSVLKIPSRQARCPCLIHPLTPSSTSTLHFFFQLTFCHTCCITYACYIRYNLFFVFVWKAYHILCSFLQIVFLTPPYVEGMALHLRCCVWCSSFILTLKYILLGKYTTVHLFFCQWTVPSFFFNWKHPVSELFWTCLLYSCESILLGVYLEAGQGGKIHETIAMCFLKWGRADGVNQFTRTPHPTTHRCGWSSWHFLMVASLHSVKQHIVVGFICT